MVQDILWKADSHSACQTVACFIYGTRMFITVLTETRRRTLSWASRIQSAPSIPTSLRSSLMLSSHLRLGLPSGSYLRASQPNSCKHLYSTLLLACHMSRPPHPTWFNHPDNIRRRIQAMKFIIMQFSPRSVFLPFRSKYPPQHTLLKNPHSILLPQSERPSFAPIQHNWQNYSFLYFNLQVFGYETGRQKRFWTEW
jgi:hypothetical protein